MSEPKKILMAAMQMDIGGAETHILELSRALTRKGYTVFVASNGGDFVAELEKSGITHCNIPLHSKSPGNIFKAYKKLKKLILQEKFDVVHAHARIPAFICGLLAKELNFRFITTAHWVFTVTPLWKRLANWGQKSVAVSQDIKQYLIDNYNMPADNVSVTINGIDTESFSPNVDASAQIAELSLNPDAKRIVCVSRMDKSRGEVPLLLAQNAERLLCDYPNLEILLVGGSVLAGEENLLNKINKIADKLNGRLGRKALITTGARTDIKELISTADIFVGVSRAALEAMAEEKPVILAGNEGYLGIFSDKNADDAIKTNFCCRGCADVSGDKLLADVKTLLETSDTELSVIGQYNRKLIEDKYSADIMANDYISAYNSLTVPNKESNILISGYYGFGNTGDESLLKAIIDSLRCERTDIGITVLSADPKNTSMQFNVNSINRINFLSISKHMRKAGLLISGGGSLLQNATSRKSLLYYLCIIKMAKRHGMKIMLYANGIGPIYDESNKKRVYDTIKNADFISLRERTSLVELENMGIDKNKLCLSADPAISLAGCDKERADYLSGLINLRGKRLLAVSLREYSSVSTETFAKECAEAISAFSEKYALTPIFIPMQPKQDTRICQSVAKQCKEAIILPPLCANELIAILKKCDFVLGMRLHLLIYALCAEKAAVGISYDPKIDAFLEYADMPKPIPAESVTKEILLRHMETVYLNRNELNEAVAVSRDFLKQKTINDAKKAIALYEESNRKDIYENGK